MVEGPSRRAVFVSGGVLAVGIGGLAAGAQENGGDTDGSNHDRSVEWDGLGEEHAEQVCSDERGYWQWVLTPGGPTSIEADAELTVTFEDGTERTVNGYQPGGGNGAVHFDVYRPGGGTVASGVARFDGGGNNPNLTIGEGGCVADDDDGPPDSELEARTASATDIGRSAATLNGELAALTGLGEASVSFEWREVNESGWMSTDAETLTEPDTVEARLDELSPGTDYEFRAVAEAGELVANGEVRSFSTTMDDPAVTTLPATSIGGSTATLHGSLGSLGTFAEVDVSFEWRAVDAASWTQTDPETRDATGSFSADIEGLEPGETYEFRAAGEVAEQTVLGEVRTFETTTARPTVVTGRATDVTGSTAMLDGELTGLGDHDVVELFFEWREAGTSEWSSTDRVSRDEPGAVATGLSGLTGETDYEFRIVAVVPDDIRVAGEIKPFTTAKSKKKPDLEADVAFSATCYDEDNGVVEYAVTNDTEHDLKFAWQLADSETGGKLVVAAGTPGSFRVAVDDPSRTVTLAFDGEIIASADGASAPQCTSS